MIKSSLKNALNASIEAETQAFKSRLERADEALAQTKTTFSKPRTANPEQPDGSIPQPLSAVDLSSEVEHVPTERVVREALTLPESEHAQIAATRQKLLETGLHVTKSEVFRAGLLLLGELSDPALRACFERLEKVKTGRPKQVS